MYVHVPFCRSRCDYCAFATWTDRQPPGRRLPRRACDATSSGRSPPSARRVETVFVGGGTPSLVPGEPGSPPCSPRSRSPPAPRSPSSATPTTSPTSCSPPTPAGGVNRISLGVQSMVPRILGLLGRRHDPDNVIGAVAAIRHVGFASFNLDLIYGAAGETLDEWRTTLRARARARAAARLGLRAHRRGRARRSPPTRPAIPTTTCRPTSTSSPTSCSPPPGSPTTRSPTGRGPGHECRHNLLYWRQHDYLGFGCAAHSHLAGRRWWNVRTPERYIAAVAAGQPTEAAGETLDAETRRLEGLQLALRTTRGVPRDALDGDGLGDLVEPARRSLGAHPPRPPARQRGGGPPALISC